MSRRSAALASIVLGLSAPIAAIGQQLPSIPDASSLVKGVPNVSSISPGNAAGVLGYCVKNKVLSGGGATNALKARREAGEELRGYSAGKAGDIVTGQGHKFSLNHLPSQAKSQACNAVLQQAPKFL